MTEKSIKIRVKRPEKCPLRELRAVPYSTEYWEYRCDKTGEKCPDAWEFSENCPLEDW